AGCVGPLPTAGLIGFLSNNASDTHWNDEYLGVGATVSTGTTTKVENGFQLAGRGTRIVWPVVRQEDNPVRSYVGEELTLVATVTISKVPTGVTSLLGVNTVGLTGDRLGLWHDEHQHWKTMLREEGNASAVTWEVGTVYWVALTVQKDGCSAYVDGQLVGSLGDQGVSPLEAPHSSGVGLGRPLLGMPSEMISNIYFEGYGDDTEEDTESHVTVTNVLLYNRCFNGSEIAALMRRKEVGTAPGPNNASVPHANRVVEAASKEVGGGDSSVRGHLSGMLLPLLLLLVMWGFSALC
ncbi:trans-sialidase, partial [Trypanosoma rangeli]